MISMAAHDFRTILTVLDGYLQFLREKCVGCPAAAGDGLIHRADRTVARLLSMANTLLDYEAAETGSIRVDVRSFLLEEALRECLNFYKNYADIKGVSLFLDPGDEGVVVRGDREKLMEILDNLLYNALKFTPPRGSIHLSGKKETGYASVTVSDSGPGIPEEKLKNLFDPGKIAATPDAHSRLGLGMIICRRLMEAQDGKMEVISNYGKGTTVSLHLPSE
jgi:signal transduction histidine kinase